MTLYQLCEQLQAFRDSSEAVTIVYHIPNASRKYIDESDVSQLHSLLQHTGKVEQINFILNSFGGDVEVARRLALLLREFSHKVYIFIAFQALSAGSILALSADQIIMGSISRLSPIDPFIKRVDTNNGELNEFQPPSVSSEDLRSFITMAHEWFGLESEGSRFTILELLCQSFFPTTLSRIYRAEKQVAQVASDLLKYQLPDAADEERNAIAYSLIRGYHSHRHSLFKNDLEGQKLNVRSMTSEEEEGLQRLLTSCDHFSASFRKENENYAMGVSGLMFTADFFALSEYRIENSDLENSSDKSDYAKAWSNWRVLMSDNKIIE